MSDLAPHLGITLMAPAQASKHIVHNEITDDIGCDYQPISPIQKCESAHIYGLGRSLSCWNTQLIGVPRLDRER